MSRYPGFAKLLFFICLLLAGLNLPARGEENFKSKFSREVKRAQKLEQQGGNLKLKSDRAKNSSLREELRLRAAVNLWQGKVIRQRLIQQAVNEYKIDTGNIMGEIAVVELPKGEFCRAYPQRKVEIGKAAFMSPGFLAATLLYANLRCGQIMEHQELKDSQQDAFDRLEATETQINRADRLGLTTHEIRILTENRREIETELSYKNRRKAAINQYRVIDYPGETETLAFNDALFSRYLEYAVLSTGASTGEILKIKISNLLSRPLKLEFPSGLIFQPEETQYESEINYQPASLDLPAQGENEIVLKGFSLQVAGLPAGEGEMLKYRIFNLGQLEEQPSDPVSRETVEKLDKTVWAGYRAAGAILKSGRELSETGKLKSYPGKNRREAVIQQALWIRSAPPGELGYPQIKGMIKTQLEAQKLVLPPDELDKTAQDFWKEINLLLRTAYQEENHATAPGNRPSR